MFRKKPVIKYNNAFEEHPQSMSPSKNHIPDWYKKIPKWKNNEIYNESKGFGHTVKQCIPFLDSLSIGYMITLPIDIYVKLDENKNPTIFSKDQTGLTPVLRSSISGGVPVFEKNNGSEFVWRTGVAFSVPKGYSMLITHPINRYDLPFITYSGVIDGGFITQPFGNMPFTINENFEGIIKQGTPIAQIIPFLQQDWDSIKIKGYAEMGNSNQIRSTSVISGWYKKTFWIKKKYN
jgi:hypothetical protein